jgi:hypothetical protein
MEVRQAGADCIPRNLGTGPFDWERDGSATHDAEIEGVVSVFPDVLGVDDQVSAERLLKAGVELVAVARVDRSQIARDSGRRNKRREKRDAASRAGDDQILVEWSLHRPRV